MAFSPGKWVISLSTIHAASASGHELTPRRHRRARPAVVNGCRQPFGWLVAQIFRQERRTQAASGSCHGRNRNPDGPDAPVPLPLRIGSPQTRHPTTGQPDKPVTRRQRQPLHFWMRTTMIVVTTGAFEAPLPASWGNSRSDSRPRRAEKARNDWSASRGWSTGLSPPHRHLGWLVLVALDTNIDQLFSQCAKEKSASNSGAPMQAPSGVLQNAGWHAFTAWQPSRHRRHPGQWYDRRKRGGNVRRRCQRGWRCRTAHSLCRRPG